MGKYIDLLKDPALNAQLKDEGYAVFPFIEAETVQQLKAYFYESHSEVPQGLYATVHSPDSSFRLKFSDYITDQLNEANEKTFQNYNALGCTYMCKAPGQKGVLYPHQDWNIVNEEEYCSYNVWLPLADVNRHNGTIEVLPRSHLAKPAFRGPNIAPAYMDLFNEIWGKLEPIEIKAGEALIYDHRLLHASTINEADTDRLVIVYGMIPDEAEMRYYYKEDDKIVEYNCNASFYLEGQPTEGPNGLEKLREIEYDFFKFTLDELNEMAPPPPKAEEPVVEMVEEVAAEEVTTEPVDNHVSEPAPSNSSPSFISRLKTFFTGK